MEYIIVVVLTVLAFAGGAGLIYWFLKPRLQTVQRLDTETIEQNRKAQAEHAELMIEYRELSARKTQLEDSIQSLDKQVKDAAELFYKTNMELATTAFEKDIEQQRLRYLEIIAEYQAELDAVMQEGASSFANEMQTKKEELANLDSDIHNLRSIAAAAVDSAKRAEEIRQQADFYKLQLSAEDIHEIEMLKNIAPYLRDKEPLNKVIWKVYYEKPTTDLIGRVVGSNIKTGIYKITNLQNGMCYVGQAVNIADRWKQHIKRGVGADAPTRNKLYPAMLALGVENFSFEVIECCERAKLDEREDYWQDYFKAKEFGYSIK